MPSSVTESLVQENALLHGLVDLLEFQNERSKGIDHVKLLGLAMNDLAKLIEIPGTKEVDSYQKIFVFCHLASQSKFDDLIKHMGLNKKGHGKYTKELYEELKKEPDWKRVKDFFVPLILQNLQSVVDRSDALMGPIKVGRGITPSRSRPRSKSFFGSSQNGVTFDPTIPTDKPPTLKPRD